MYIKSMTIYFYGCQGCGTLGARIRAVKKLHPDVVLKNIKYSEENRLEYETAITLNKPEIPELDPIVVDGSKVTELKLWKP